MSKNIAVQQQPFDQLSPLKKLAFLMRLGLAVRGQSYGLLFNMGKETSCALGAAIEGTYLLRKKPYQFGDLAKSMGNTESWHATLYETTNFPLEKWEVRHPVDDTWASIDDVIEDLNDSEGWTREQIADWLETEPELCEDGDDEDDDEGDD